MRGTNTTETEASTQLGSEADFERTFTLSYSRLVAELTVVTTSRTEAEEAVQEAFARLWQCWPKVRSYDQPETWVRRVAINGAIDHWRRNSRLRPLSDMTSLQRDEDYSGVSALLLDGLSRLSAKQRTALLLHHVLGLSVEEVAREMSAKAGTVKSWLSRGRAELQVLLQDWKGPP